MGSRAGRLGGGSGDGSRGEIPTLGEGALVKLSCRGVVWNGVWTGAGVRSVETAGLGGGLHDGLDDIGRAGVNGEGDTTLGGSPAWKPLDNQASGFEVSRRMEAQAAAMIRRCPEGWKWL